MTKTLYKNAQVFTGDNDSFKKLDFIVDEETGNFNHVAKESPIQYDKEIDLTEKFVIPGLINAHTHIVADPYERISKLGADESTAAASTFMALRNLSQILRDGVTYIRDVGSTFDIDIELAKLERQGDLTDAPGIIASGKSLAMTGGHLYKGSYEVDGPDETRKYARILLKKGVDNIKLMATGGVSFSGERPEDVQLTEIEMRAAVEEAHHKGKTAAAHAQGNEGIKNAIRAGVDSIEHGVYLDDEAIDLLLKHDTFLVPTLSAPWSMEKYATNLPDFMIKKSREIQAAHIESIEKAAQAGVKIVLGTDSGTAYNNFNNQSTKELELLVANSHLTTLQALQAATVNAAALLKINDFAGSITAGKFADFIILDNNPLKDITVLQQAKKVYKKGKAIQ